MLHRRPVRPGRAALHPRLLPAAGRADRRRGRARAGHQGHGRAAAPARRDPRWSSALRREFDLPIHLHTHDTPGGQLATYLAAIAAGADAIDGASAALAGTTSQPALSSIVAATDHTPHATGLDLPAVCDLEPYWEAVRRLYAPFESGLPAPTGRVYRHEIPGGQLSNLRQQAIALGLGDRFEDIEAMYAAADRILGRLVKVTPSSKVVGDLALHLVGAGVSPERVRGRPGRFDVPESVIGFLRGELGDPPGGWPEPFRSKALAGRAAPRAGGPAELTEADRDGLRTDPRRPSTGCSSPARPSSSPRTGSRSGTPRR